MTKPKALDLFCGCGLVADGLMQAGFDVTGIDIDPKLAAWYPADFICADATRPPVRLDDFDLIWASPPCQAYSECTPERTRPGHPALLQAIRELLADHPHTCIEGVRVSPMRADLRLTGRAVGLPRLVRERRFELSWLLRWGIDQPHMPPTTHEERYTGYVRPLTSSNGYPFRQKHLRSGYLSPDVPICLPVEEVRAMMGVKRPLPHRLIGQGIPPPMAAYIGHHAIQRIREYA